MKKLLLLTLILLALSLSACRIVPRAAQKDNMGQIDTINDNAVVNSTMKACDECIVYSPPAPDWCQEGTIISPQKDECGCLGKPTCGVKGQVNTNQQNCAQAGEPSYEIDLTTGKTPLNPKSCCADLRGISSGSAPEDESLCMMAVGGNPICAPCGNGECESQYGENRCNCREDCVKILIK